MQGMRTGAIVGAVGGVLLGVIDAGFSVLRSIDAPASALGVLGLVALTPLGSALFWGLALGAGATVVGAAARALGLALEPPRLAPLLAALLALGAVSAAVFVGAFTTGAAPAPSRLSAAAAGAAFGVLALGVPAALGSGMLALWLVRSVRAPRPLACAARLAACWIVLAGGLVWLLWFDLHRPPHATAGLGLRIAFSLVVLALLALPARGLYAETRALLGPDRAPGRRTVGLLGVSSAGLVLCAWLAATLSGADHAAAPDRVARAAPPADAPNVLWIVMDTVRADHLSCYGYGRPTTPRIDAFAAEGILYERAISPAPWTLPAHASMFTGMYPSKHQTTTMHRALARELTTAAEVFRSHGYRTAAFSNNPWVSATYGMDQGFDSFYEGHRQVARGPRPLLARALFRLFERPEQRRLQGRRTAYRTNQRLGAFLAEHPERGVPFFAFVNYMEAHTEYHPPEAEARRFLPESVDLEAALRVEQRAAYYRAGLAERSEESLEILRALYDGEIQYLDGKIGELLDLLRSRGVLDDTVVVITSDHGESFGEHGMMAHQFSVYDEVLRVPLIIRFPRAFAPGTRDSSLVQTTQILATLLDLAGLAWDGRGALQGQSLLGAQGRPLAITEYSLPPEAIGEIARLNPNVDVSGLTRNLKAIRDETHKYIWASDGRNELYDLARDPLELDDRIRDDPARAAELQGELAAWLVSFDRPDLSELDDAAAPVDDETQEALRALGYVD